MKIASSQRKVLVKEVSSYRELTVTQRQRHLCITKLNLTCSYNFRLILSKSNTIFERYFLTVSIWRSSKNLANQQTSGRSYQKTEKDHKEMKRKRKTPILKLQRKVILRINFGVPTRFLGRSFMSLQSHSEKVTRSAPSKKSSPRVL